MCGLRKLKIEKLNNKFFHLISLKEVYADQLSGIIY